MSGTKQRTRSTANGQATAEQVALAEAITSEQAIADEAAGLRGDATELTPELFHKLWALARRPIPQGFIERVPAVQGKPYESTGVRSIQVQIDRMDNVWTPLWWGWQTEWSDDGKLALVKVWVGPRGEPLADRSARGGVERGTGQGNIYKGAETNAGKLAFARIGPGHEVYLGAADFDPDTDKAAADEQGKAEPPPPAAGISADDVAALIDRYQKAKDAAEDAEKFGKDAKVKFGALGASAPSVNKAIASLTPAQAVEFDAWLAEREPKGGGE